MLNKIDYFFNMPDDLIRLIIEFIADNEYSFKSIPLINKRFNHLFKTHPKLPTLSPLIDQIYKTKQLIRNHTNNEIEELKELQQKLDNYSRELNVLKLGYSYNDLLPLINDIKNMPVGNYFKASRCLKEYWKINLFYLLFFISEIITLSYLSDSLNKELSAKETAEERIKIYSKDETPDEFCDNNGSEICKPYVDSATKVLLSICWLALTLVVIILTLGAYWCAFFNRRDALQNLPYIDYPIDYLLTEHRDRLKMISSIYRSEFKQAKFTKISDIISFLENLYDKNGKRNPDNLSIECDVLKNILKDEIKSHKPGSTLNFNQQPKVTFFRNVNRFFKQADEYLKENSREEQHLSLEGGEEFPLLSIGMNS